jgi:peptidoglycan/LPS O-acetylase OafA/YrhL
MILLVIALGILASVAVQIALWWNGASAWRLYNGLDTHGHALLIGCAIGLLFAWRLLPVAGRARMALRLGAATAAALLVFLLVTATWYADYMYYGVGSLAFFGAGLILVEVLTARSRVSALLEARPVVWVGRISYGLYIWHYPIFRYITFGWFGATTDVFDLAAIKLQVVRFSLTLVVATCSFYFIESPMLRLKRRFSPLSATVHSASRPLVETNS